MVVIRTFLNHVDADMAKSALEAAEIVSEIHADDCGGVRPHLWMGGVQLLVDEADVAEAVEILDSSIGVFDPGTPGPGDPDAE